MDTLGPGEPTGADARRVRRTHPRRPSSRADERGPRRCDRRRRHGSRAGARSPCSAQNAVRSEGDHRCARRPEAPWRARGARTAHGARRRRARCGPLQPSARRDSAQRAPASPAPATRTVPLMPLCTASYEDRAHRAGVGGFERGRIVRLGDDGGRDAALARGGRDLGRHRRTRRSRCRVSGRCVISYLLMLMLSFQGRPAGGRDECAPCGCTDDRADGPEIEIAYPTAGSCRCRR